MVVRKARLIQAAPGATGNQNFDFSLGGKVPWLVRFRVTGAVTSGTVVTHARTGEGWSDGTNQWAVGNMGEHNLATGSADCGFRATDDAVICFPLTTSEAVDAKAAFSSFSANRVTINWSDVPATAVQVECTVWYGDDGAGAVGIAAGNATSGQTTVVSCPFQLGLLHVSGVGAAMSTDNSGASARRCAGVASYFDGTIKQACQTLFERDRGSTSTRVGQAVHADKIAKAFTVDATGAVTDGAGLQLTAVTSSSFTVTTVDVSAALTFGWAAIKTNRQRVWSGFASVVAPPGGGADVALVDVSVTGTHVVKDPGFRAVDVEAVCTGLRVSTRGTTVNASPAGLHALGGSDGTTSGQIASVFQVGQATSVARCLTSSGWVRVIDPAGADLYAATLVQNDLGFEVNVTTAAPNDRELFFAAMGEVTLEAPTAVALPLVLPAPTVTRTEVPAAVALPLLIAAPTRLVTEVPAAVALPLLIAAPSRLLTELPSPVNLALALPAPTVTRTEVPAAVVLPLLIAAPARLVTEVPAPVDLALLIAAPSRLLTELPTPVALPLLIAAPARLLTEVPAAVELEMVLPPVTVLSPGIEQPAAVTLPLALPAPSIRVDPNPTAVALPLLIATPARLLTELPAPVALALALPAPAVLVSEVPAAVALPLVLPPVAVLLAGGQAPDAVALELEVQAPLLQLTRSPAPVALVLALPAPAFAVALAPDPVVLALVVPSPITEAVLGVELLAEVARALQLEAETVRTCRFEVPATRALELAAAVE